MSQINREMEGRINVDPALAESLGLRVVAGKHLILWTDIRTSEGIDDLPICFDRAVVQWCKLFDVNPKKAEPWCLVAFLMVDREKFQKAGMFPKDLPDFPTGFNRGYHFWVFQQPGDYYTRHLVLHEGTHAFMQWFLKGTGPAWYSEGMAEKVGLHRWKNRELELNACLLSYRECEYWGRPKLIQQLVAESKTIRLDQVFDLGSINFRDVAAYAWAWSSCEFLSRHPITASRFGRLTNQASDTTAEFSLKFKSSFKKEDWEILERDWQLFLEEMTYGTQANRTALCQAAVGNDPAMFQIRTDRSWQSTEIKVEPGQQLTVATRGQFVILTDEGTSIPCEANGITLKYYRRYPLGTLMASILQPDQKMTEAVPLGNAGTFRANSSGILHLRINESPAALADNQGDLEVVIHQ